MESFEVEEAQTAPRQRFSIDLVWNILTIIALVLILGVGTVVLLIFFNPTIALNMFPPPTMIPLPVLPTATNTPRIILEPSWTPTIALPTIPLTPRPSNTPLVTATPYGFLPGNTPTFGPSLTPGGFAFAVMPGSPSAIPGASFHPDLGCDWIGVAGQVLGMNGEPIRFQIVHLGGSVEGQTIDSLIATGMAPAYGPAGFEFIIANRLLGTTGTVWIQLEDVQGLPMSDRIFFNTYGDCNQNLVVIYLQQVR
jgi:hypothetical protein